MKRATGRRALFRRAALSVVVLSLAATPPLATAAAAERTPPAGWSAGPEDDAVMEVGQRFDCRGADCPPDLSCLYALAPPRPPGSWPIDIPFMLDETRMPWQDVEGWLIEKAKTLRPQLATDPLVTSGRSVRKSAPHTVTLTGADYVLRQYRLPSKAGSFDLDAYLWSVKGRLRIAFCIAPTGQPSVRAASRPVEELLGYLRRDEDTSTDN
ncbi:hypothetical protein [Jiella sonneratiae]|uniref:DUF1795 domain-containing protein n=1 Tax=Jiella sonneratiae TaxID=2816856 RepID=A0ABS3J2G1_9HYPH|nr:hypothetical protein [Jiella sonneratiae]MBO0903859.1 hypothetical protein [Jiella sonneratiae]